MRLFIAIELPPQLKKLLSQIQADLKKLVPDGWKITWVKLENLHLTVQFIGSVEEPRLKEVVAAVQRAASEMVPFKVCLSSLNLFPAARPRVILVGASGQLEVYRKLQKQVRRELKAAGCPLVSGVAPHVTLGRIKKLDDRLPKEEWVKLAEKHLKGALELVVDRISLVQSTLTPRGSVYETLETLPLQPV